MSTATATHNDNALALARQIKKAAPKDRIALRQRCIAAMPAKLKEYFDELESHIAEQVRGSLLNYWKLGEQANDIYNKSSESPEEYTEKPIDVVSACLQQDYSVLYKAMHFFRSYNEQELESLLNLRMKGTGTPVMWSHVVALLTVESKAKRNQLLNQCVQHNWTHEELIAEVNKVLGKNGNDKQPGGRKHKIPKTVSAMLHNLDFNVSPVAKKFETVWNNEDHGILRLVQNTDPSEISPEMLGEFDRLIAVLEEVKDGASRQIKQLTEGKKRAQAVLNKKEKEAAKAEANGEVDGEEATKRKTGRPKKEAANA